MGSCFRQVFMEYENGLNFDHYRFETDLIAERATLKPPSCTDEIKKFVVRCTKFEHQSRPPALESLEIARLLKENLETTLKLDFRPYYDSDQKFLIHPIGFDHTRNRVSIGEHSISYEIPRVDEDYEEGAEDDFSRFIKSETLLKKLITRHKNLQEFFDRKIETAEKLNLAKRAVEVIKAKIDEPFIFDDYSLICLHEKPIKKSYVTNLFDLYSGKMPDQEETYLQSISTPDPETIDVLIEKAIDEDFLQLFIAYRELILGNVLISSTSFGFWHLLAMAGSCLAGLEKTKSCVTKRLYFKSFLMLSTKMEWLFVGDFFGSNYFTKRSLNESKRIYGHWRGDTFVVFDEKENRELDQMHFLQLEPVDLDMMIVAMKAIKLRIQKFARSKIRNYLPIKYLEAGSEFLSTSQGLDLPIPGYIFQLRNPPRHICKHTPKCPLKGGFPVEVDREFQLTYFQCADQSFIDYIYLYVKYIKFLHLTLMMSRKFHVSALIPKESFGKEELEKLICPKYFLFYQHSSAILRKFFAPSILLDLPRGDHDPITTFHKVFTIIQVNCSKKDIDLENAQRVEAEELFRNDLFNSRNEYLLEKTMDQAKAKFFSDESNKQLQGLIKDALNAYKNVLISNQEVEPGTSASIQNMMNVLSKSSRVNNPYMSNQMNNL